jgi:hypothetical protein
MPSVVTMTGPGTATVTDDAAVAIGLQTAALTADLLALGIKLGGIPETPIPGTLVSIDAQLTNMNNTLNRIADHSKAISSQMSKLSVDIAGLGSATQQQTALQSMAIANQVQTNNFQVQATKDALKRAGLPEPELPPIEEQLKQTVKDGLTFGIIAREIGIFNQFVSNMLTDLGTWFAGTAVYKTVDKWVGDVKDSILSPEIPSLETIKSKAAAFLGIKEPPNP